MSTNIKLAIGSIIVGVIVLAIKMLAWWLTGSVALFSDALESTVNVATAIAALIAIRIATRPADDSHPYGHDKAEFFSAVLEGVMIIIAALLILREAYLGVLIPVALDLPIEGLLVNGGATAINAFWAWILVTRGRTGKSPALVADGRHLFTDVVTSAGVAFGVLLATVTGWWILDPLMAAGVAINILLSGSRVVMESLSGLMDEAVPQDTLEKVRSVISAEAGGAMERRSADPARRQRDLHRLPSRGARRNDCLRCARDLRPYRGGASGCGAGCDDHNTRRAGTQAEALRYRRTGRSHGEDVAAAPPASNWPERSNVMPSPSGSPREIRELHMRQSKTSWRALYASSTQFARENNAALQRALSGPFADCAVRSAGVQRAAGCFAAGTKALFQDWSVTAGVPVDSAIIAMMLVGALHPSGRAIALLTALDPARVLDSGPALRPIDGGSLGPACSID